MATLDTGTATERLRAARDFLLAQREDYDAAYREFRWPAARRVQLGARLVRRDRRRGRRAPGAVDRRGGRRARRRRTFAELSARSNQVANWLREPGRRARRPDHRHARQPGRAVGDDPRRDEARRGDHPRDAAARPGRPGRPRRARRRPPRRRHRRRRRASSTTCPATTRASRSASRSTAGCAYADADGAPTDFAPDGPTAAGDPLLLYFTSGTTAQPKLVEHTPRVLSRRAPVDHVLDRHPARRRPPQRLLARAGRKHAWSNVFAPWNAEATRDRVQLRALRRRRRCSTRWSRCGVTTFCAPPTVWRMLIQEDLGRWQRARCARRSPPASRSTPR